MTPPRSRCDAVREALWPDPDAPGPAEAREHYAQCSECRDFFVRDRELAGRLACLSTPCAPDHLRARVLALLAHARPGYPRRWPLRAVALAAAAAVVLLMLTRGDDMGDVVAPLAAEARVAETSPLAVTSADPGVISGWFAATMGSPVPVPAITDAELVGGRVATIGGMPAAVVLYRMHGDPLTYFALHRDAMPGPEMPGDELMVAQAADVQVAVWMEQDGPRAVAAAMPRETVTAVAAECRRKAAMMRS